MREPRGDSAQLRLRALRRDAVGEAAEDLQREMLAALLRRQVRHLRERNPEIGAERELHPFRHHADDGRRHVVDPDRASEDRRIAAVARLPDAVAENRHRRRARLVVVGQETAAEQRPLADEPEGVGRDVRPLVALRNASFVADAAHDPVGADRAAKLFCAWRKSSKSRYETPMSVPRTMFRPAIDMMRSGSSNGRPRMRTALTNVNTVALTPMPSASATTATAVNQRSFTSRRTANRRS